MHKIAAIAAAGLLALVVGCTSSTAANKPRRASAGQSGTASVVSGTERVIIRPVDAAGHPAAGFSVTTETEGQLACGQQPEQSMVAVSPHIAFCLPGAEYAVACWPSSTVGQALCFRDAWAHTVTSVATEQPLDTSAITAPGRPQPLALLLADGDHCTIRDLGAWDRPAEHPDWVGYYSCRKDGAVWAPPDAAADAGIDQSQPRWSVQVAPASGSGSFRTEQVDKVYFVGTLGG